jgi:molybdopterin synthase catalytic subunit
MFRCSVTIQQADFDVGAELAALREGDAGIGAVAAFVGTVRDRGDAGAVRAMELEHYPGMTERAIEAMIDEARRRFDLRGVRVIHRVGTLKTQAPFWKKESTPEGAHWVDARVADDAALARWGIAAGNAL